MTKARYQENCTTLANRLATTVDEVYRLLTPEQIEHSPLLIRLIDMQELPPEDIVEAVEVFGKTVTLRAIQIRKQEATCREIYRTLSTLRTHFRYLGEEAFLQVLPDKASQQAAALTQQLQELVSKNTQMARRVRPLKEKA